MRKSDRAQAAVTLATNVCARRPAVVESEYLDRRPDELCRMAAVGLFLYQASCETKPQDRARS